MFASERQSACAHSESLVLIEVLPLCRIEALDEPWQDGPGKDGGSEAVAASSERPLRCAAVMSCPEAFALLEEVGDVAW